MLPNIDATNTFMWSSANCTIKVSCNWELLICLRSYLYYYINVNVFFGLPFLHEQRINIIFGMDILKDGEYGCRLFY